MITPIEKIYNDNNSRQNSITKIHFYQETSICNTLNILFDELDVILSHFRTYGIINYSKNISRSILSFVSNLYDNKYSTNPKHPQYYIEGIRDILTLKTLPFINTKNGSIIFRLINMCIFVYLLNHFEIDDSIIFLEEGDLQKFIDEQILLIDVEVKQYNNKRGNKTQKIVIDLVDRFQTNVDILLYRKYHTHTSIWIVKLQNYSEYKNFSSFKDIFKRLRFK